MNIGSKTLEALAVGDRRGNSSDWRLEVRLSRVSWVSFGDLRANHDIYSVDAAPFDHFIL